MPGQWVVAPRKKSSNNIIGVPSWISIPSSAYLQVTNQYGDGYDVGNIKDATSGLYWCSQKNQANAVITITFQSPVTASGFRLKPGYPKYPEYFFGGYTLSIDGVEVKTEGSITAPTTEDWKEFPFDTTKGTEYQLTMNKRTSSTAAYFCVQQMEIRGDLSVNSTHLAPAL